MKAEAPVFWFFFSPFVIPDRLINTDWMKWSGLTEFISFRQNPSSQTGDERGAFLFGQGVYTQEERGGFSSHPSQMIFMVGHVLICKRHRAAVPSLSFSSTPSEAIMKQFGPNGDLG